MDKTVKILNETGLHARPAALIVKEASKFKSDIKIEHKTKIVNAKSIMNIMGLGLGSGEEVKIIASGPDEDEAVEALARLIESKFGEA